MKRTKSKKPWFPRRFWYIKPFDRIKESKKVYNRKREKILIRKYIAEALDEIYS